MRVDAHAARVTRAKASDRLPGTSAKRRWETLAYPSLELVRLELRLCCEFNYRRGDRVVVATDAELDRAMRLVFTAVQCELDRRGVGFRPRVHTERTALFKIWRAADQARQVIGWRPAEAKRIQLEATGGQPLAVCIGKLFRDGLTHSHSGDGCGAVFLDSTSLKPPKFVSYCPQCRERKFVRELDARRRARYHGRQAVPLPDGSYLYFAKCWCGQVFRTDDVRQTRCWTHHDVHGAPPPPKRTSAG
jgi:hypothetical protein